MNSLKFSEADLNANQQGLLSPRQREWVDTAVSEYKRNSKYLLWFFLMIFAPAYMLIIPIEYHNAGHDLGKTVSASLGDFVLITLVLLGFWGVFRILYGWSVSMLGKISKTEGNAVLIYPIPGLISNYRVKIDAGPFSSQTKTFLFDDAESLSYFKEGQRYRVYYLGTTRMLSAEPVFEKQRFEFSESDQGTG